MQSGRLRKMCLGVDETYAYIRSLKVGDCAYSGPFIVFAGVASFVPEDVEEHNTPYKERYGKEQLLELFNGSNGRLTHSLEREVRFLVARKKRLNEWWWKNSRESAPLVVRATPHLVRAFFNGNGTKCPIQMYYDGEGEVETDTLARVIRTAVGREIEIEGDTKFYPKSKKDGVYESAGVRPLTAGQNTAAGPKIRRHCRQKMTRVYPYATILDLADSFATQIGSLLKFHYDPAEDFSELPRGKSEPFKSLAELIVKNTAFLLG